MRGVADANALLACGVNCSLSTNNVLNPFTPFGDCSLIRIANLYANVAQRGGEDEMAEIFEMLTNRSARLLRREDYGIEVGKPADLVVWDPEKERTISKDTHHQNIDFNIFEGMTVKGINVVTVSQGNVVYQDGEVRTVKGAGRYVNRPTYAPYYGAMEITRKNKTPSAVSR